MNKNEYTENVQEKCQINDEEENCFSKNCAKTNFISFNEGKIFCKMMEDQIDNINENSFKTFEYLISLDDNLFLKKIIKNEVIDSLKHELENELNSENENSIKLIFIKKLRKNVENEFYISNFKPLLPLILNFVHSKARNFKTKNLIIAHFNTYSEIRNIAIEIIDIIIHHHGNTSEKKVNSFLNKLRVFCDQLQKNENEKNLDQKLKKIDYVLNIQHPIETTSDLMKLTFDETYRSIIRELDGINTLKEMLILENDFHGSFLNNHNDNLEHVYDCITLRRYTSMALTNLAFENKQCKQQLCLDIQFLNSVLPQLNCFYSEELIQVTSSVLRNLSWKASKLCKNIFKELDCVTILMVCSMQVKKETTLKCVLYALRNLSSHSVANKQKICEVEGSIKFLISLLNYKSGNDSQAIVENGGGVLKNISNYFVKFENLRKILRVNSCHKILLKQLGSTSLTIVCNAVNILWNISKENLLDQKVLIFLGAISLLKNLTFSKHKIIAAVSKETLKNLLTSECFKKKDFDTNFRTLSLDFSRSDLLIKRKKMLFKREIEENLTKSLSTTSELSTDKILKENLVFIKNDFDQSDDEDISKILNKQVIDVSHSFSDYFDTYKENSIKDNESFYLENGSLSETKEKLDNSVFISSKTVFSQENIENFDLNNLVTSIDTKNMISSINFVPGYLNDLENSSIYSTISEPISYDNFSKKNFSKNIFKEEFLLKDQFSYKNSFPNYNNENIFHAYPVIIQESYESKNSNSSDLDIINKSQNTLNKGSNKEEVKSNIVKIEKNTKINNDLETKSHKANKTVKSRLPRSKTLEQKLNLNSITKSKTTEWLNDRTFDISIHDDDSNNDNTDNDLTYNIEEIQQNVTYVLPSSESDLTLKNECTVTEDKTLVNQVNYDDEKTDKNLDEIKTFVQNSENHPSEADDATLNINGINLDIKSGSNDSLNLDSDFCTEITDSFSFIENTNPPKLYNQINFSISSSLNSSFKTENKLQAFKNKTTEVSSNNNLMKSKLRAPKTRLSDLDNSFSSLSTNNKSSKSIQSAKTNKSFQFNKDQAMSTSGYQTSLNSSSMNSSYSMIEKIKPPLMMSQISGFSSTFGSLSSINSDVSSGIYDLKSVENSLIMINKKKSNNVVSNNQKLIPKNTSTPKHFINNDVKAKIVKPVSRIVKTQEKIQTQCNTDTFRKNKYVKKPITSNSSNSKNTEAQSKKIQTNSSNENTKAVISQSPVVKPFPTSKSLSKISTLSYNQVTSEKLKKKSSPKLSSLWKKTVSNQQNLSSKTHKTNVSILDSKNFSSKIKPPKTSSGLLRSSTFEKLPTSTEDAIKLGTINKSKISPSELRKEKKKSFLSFK